MASRKQQRTKQHRAEAVATADSSPRFSRPDVLIAATLVVVTLVIYGQVLTHRFIKFDDDVYISSNQMVIDGLTLKGVAWAFTTFESANWHPLTWLSHMVDSQLFGLNAGGHLFVNALIHSANGLLLFLFLRRVTGARWRSAIVAALFSLHPLHVESVAWAAERKDTLSTLLGLLSLLAYARYVAKPSRTKYTLVAVWLAFGLMAKPMLVSWPFVLLLLDYWPLRRIEWHPAGGIKQFARDSLPLIREKVPFLCLAVPSMVVTYIAQSHGDAMSDLIVRPLPWRMANALVSYAKYLLLTFWPTDLAILYPSSRDTAPLWQWTAALVLLCAITLVAAQNARVRPYLIAGWLWFLGTLLPVIGLVRVGSQAMADRYTYIPSIGLFFALIFSLADLAKTWRIDRTSIAIASAGMILSLSFLTSRQINRWRDSETLFPYVLSVTSDNPVMQYNLGCVLQQQGKQSEAVSHFAEAVRIKPYYLHALANMGLALKELGKAAEAIGAYQRALELEPKSVKVRWQLGEALMDMGKSDDALQQFYEAMKLTPLDSGMRTNLGVKLARQNKFAEATEQFEEALRLDPDNAEAHDDLGLVFLSTGQPDKALEEFATTLRLKPDTPGARDNLRRAQEQVNGPRK